jgi:TorA maturation chaperone TorD
MESGDAAGARRKEKELKRFWALHLGLWVRGYAQLIERAAEHSFFREMAGLLQRFAEAEIEILGLKVLDEDGGRYRAPKPEMPEGRCGGRR